VSEVFEGVRLTLELPDRDPEDIDHDPTARELAELRELAAERADALPAWVSDTEWSADLEYVWRSRSTAAIARLGERAERMRRTVRDVERMEREFGRVDVLLPAMRIAATKSAEWAEDRAQAMAMSRADVVALCGQRWRSVACGCGPIEFKVGCDQPQLCGPCRRRHTRKWQQRITKGLDAALRAARARYHETPRYRRRGMLPGIYLMTLTAPHSGDLATDRERMGKAVRKLLKHANKYRWWSTYALTWEATNGDDGLGHMHCHLAVISGWIPYRREEVIGGIDAQERWDSESPNARPVSPRIKRRVYLSERGLHDVWRDAMPGALVLDVKAPRQGSDDAATGGQYLAKYVTKGVDPSEFTGRKAGELLVAFRGCRKVSTSQSFWDRSIPECECCGTRYRSVLAPMSLQQTAPASMLRAMSERTRWRDPGRCPPQVDLRWSSSGR